MPSPPPRPGPPGPPSAGWQPASSRLACTRTSVLLQPVWRRHAPDLHRHTLLRNTGREKCSARTLCCWHPQLLSMDVRTYLYKIRMYLYIEGSRGHAWRNALQIYKHQPPNQGCSVLDPRWCRAFRWCQPSDANCLTQQCSAEARQSRRDY